MDLYDVMRTTAAVREFTDDPLPDDVLHRILDNARFAPSGGNPGELAPGRDVRAVSLGVIMAVAGVIVVVAILFLVLVGLG